MLRWTSCIVLLLLVAWAGATTMEDADLSEQFYSGYKTYRSSQVITPEFNDLLNRFSFKGSVMRDGYGDRVGMCSVCNAVVRTVLNFHASGVPKDELMEMLGELCVLLNIESEAVCEGVIESNADIFFYIMENNPGLRAEKVCGLLLQGDGCNPNHAIEYTLEVPLGEKPAPEAKTPDENGNTLTVVQFTDIHTDPRYQVGGNAECGEPTCCRSNQGQPSSPAQAAGYWGDYRSCDMPWHAVLDALDQIRKQNEKIDFIYMTGDLVDHGVWETSRELNTGIFNKFYEAINEKFPYTPLYASLGNHEPHPLNVYAPTSVTDDALSTNWLYNASLQHWKNIINDDISSTVLTGGFYTAVAKPGLRIISLNNNVCYIYNWWLLDSHGTDLINDQLNWLVETLKEAEKAGEKVHILTHIPPGSGDTLYSCSREFRKIINRFENTVVAQFNGHTHNDEFHIFYALEDPDRPTNVALNGGSGTTYSNLNPNYKVYKVDAATGLVLDSETWIYNITEANLNGSDSPKWYKMYSFREAFGVRSLTPSELDILAHKMADDAELVQKYHRYYLKNSDRDWGCNTQCLDRHLCQIVTDHAPDTSHCASLIK